MQMLRLEGAEGVAVDNGEAAVTAATREPGAWSCVLMDVHMPVMDGLTATRMLATQAPRLPVIGQSADALQESRAACLGAGMVDQVTKPVDLEALVATVLRHAVPCVHH
jgi:two-component system sensor histidine kinase/response regulator